MHIMLRTGLIAGIFLIIAGMVYTVAFKDKNTDQSIHIAQASTVTPQIPSKTISDQPKKSKTDTIKRNKPDFAAFKEVKQKKAAFFGYLLPMVQKVNASITEERSRILAIQQKQTEDLPLTEDVLIMLCDRYEAKCDKGSTQKSIANLLLHVDAIPPSLALAQAANESAWGTSRFARKANNYYGQWCFTKGCGLVPNQRNAGSHHEVRKFDSALGSVKSYIHNLNTHRAYKNLRAIRAQQREVNQTVTGDALAVGLMSYSERGKHYVDEIRAMIRHNKLAQYDELRP